MNNSMKTMTKSFIIITVIFMDFLTGMEFDLFVPSFTQLQQQFQLTPFWVEALLSANLVGYCFSLFFVGGLADKYGRKPIILAGLIVFNLATVLCLFTDHFSWLLMGRFLQGMGVAAPAILSFLIIADAYSLKQQQFLLAILNGSLNIATAVAPVLGSYLTLFLGWRGNFAALLSLGFITLSLTLCLPKLQLPIKNSISLDGYSTIFKSRSLCLLISTIILFIVPYWIFVGMSPLLYVKDLHVSLRHFGYYQGVFALVFAVGSVIYGFILKMRDFDQKQMLFYAALLLMVSLLILLTVTFSRTMNPLYITLGFLPFVIGQIIPSAIMYPLALNSMPQVKGRISALIQGGRLLVTAISLQIAGYVYQGNFFNIGIILSLTIFLVIMAMFMVIANKAIMTRKMS